MIPNLFVGAPILWNLTDGAAIDFDFFVEGQQEPQWTRQMIGRIAENPCTGARTAIQISDGTMSKLRATLKIGIQPLNASDSTTRLAAFAAIWFAMGPYTLTMPTGRQKTILFDPEVGWSEQRQYDGSYLVQIGIAEQ